MTNQAEAMREAAAKVADDMARNISAFDIAVQKGGERASKRIAELIRALPLPKPSTDPRDALIGTDVSDAAIAAAIAEEARLDALAEAEIEACERRGHHAGWTPEAPDYASAATTPYRDALRVAKATIARLSAELEAARGALEPFAAYAEAAFPDDDSYRPEHNALSHLSHHRGRNDWLHVTVFAFRHARAVLAKLTDRGGV